MKKNRKNKRLLVVSVILAIFACEVLLQLLFHARNSYWLWSGSIFRVEYVQKIDDRRGYGLKPGYDDKAAGIKINSLGFRGDEIPPDTKNLIVALGDSVPFGVKVRDGQTYAYLLDLRARQMGIDVRVLNAGVPSYNLRQSFDRFRFDVMKYYKNVICVTMQTANDISLLTRYRQDYGPDTTWAGYKCANVCPLIENIKLRSAIFHYIDWKTAKSSRKRKGYYPSDRMIKNINAVLEKNLEFFNSSSIPVVLMPADPFYYQTKNIERNKDLALWAAYREHAANWGVLINSFNNTMKNAAESGRFKNVFFFDTRKVMDEEERDLMYSDFIHYSYEGNRVIAKALFDFLSKNKLLPEKEGGRF